MSERIYVFKRFERFWHWSQAALIIALMVTGSKSTAATNCLASVRRSAFTRLPPGHW